VAFIVYGDATIEELERVLRKQDVLYVIGLIVFDDRTGTYEQQFCEAITIRELPEGGTIHYETRCGNFNDEVPRNSRLKTFR
jgi:hypothetical protein